MTYLDRHGQPLRWHRTVCCDWEAYDHQVFGIHQHDLAGNRIDPTRTPSRLVEPKPVGGYAVGPATKYVWFEFLTLCRLTGMAPTTTDVECCHCHQTVSVGQAWSAVAVDQAGKPRSGFLHCGKCRLLLGAGTAWHAAHGETAKPVPDSASIRG